MKILQLRKNSTLIIVSMLLLTLGIRAQSVESIYINMPDLLMPTLNKQSRNELVEYFKAGQTDSIRNRFGRQVSLFALDTLNGYLSLKTTSSSTFEIKVLKLENGTLALGVINSICGPVCQSAVNFYDTAWNVIPLKFKMPEAVDWLSKDIPENLGVKWVEGVLENSFVTLHFDPKKSMIEASNNSLEFMSDDERKLIKPLLTDKKLLFKLVGKDWVAEF